MPCLLMINNSFFLKVVSIQRIIETAKKGVILAKFGFDENDGTLGGSFLDKLLTFS